jgi:hypothetical protein
MPDYHSPTVVQPAIPLGDLSPLERLLLTHMLNSKIDDLAQTLFAYSEFGAVHRPVIVIGQLRRAFEQSRGYASQILAHIAGLIDNTSRLDDGEQFELDVDDELDSNPFLLILQDIVRRSPRVTWFSVLTSYTCSRMEPDGFGGSATLVSADRILHRSTDDLLEEFVGEVRLAVA